MSFEDLKILIHKIDILILEIDKMEFTKASELISYLEETYFAKKKQLIIISHTKYWYLTK